MTRKSMAFLPAATVTPIFSVVYNLVAQLLADEYRLRRDVRKTIRRLKNTLSLTEIVLKELDGDPKPRASVRAWADQLRRILYTAHDVLDRHATSSALLSRRRRASRRILRPLLRLLHHPFLSSRAVARAIEEIREEFEALAQNRAGLSINPSAEPRAHRFNPTTSFPTGPVPVLGRDAEVADLLCWLLDDDDHAPGGLRVRCVVGIGGIGKTALTRVAYNHDRVKDRFDAKMWICVTEDFDVSRITRHMLESVADLDGGGGPERDPGSLDALQKALAGKIEGKSFLLVLDDAWKEDQSEWRKLLAPLDQPDRNTKGKVIVTCRSRTVAGSAGAGADAMILLEGLDRDSLVRIFDAFAFGDRPEVPNRAQLEEIRNTMVASRLKGSPLAAGTIGRLLGFDLDLEYWKGIASSEIWEVEGQREDDLFPVLYLSYQHLPTDLKQCFAYCSLFPKGHAFRRERLIWLWMAQSFIQEANSLSFEVIGRRCFDKLCHRLFLEPDGSSGLYRMHHLIHDLAELAWKDECIRVDHGRSNAFEDPMAADKVRHVSFISRDPSAGELEVLSKCKNLRTLLLDRSLRADSERICDIGRVDVWCRKLKSLRILDLRSCQIEKLPDWIGNLKLLRYLNLANNPVKYLSEKLCNLYNLQVLDLQDCSQIQELPTGMSELVNLRQLRIISHYLHALDGIGELSSIQELQVFRVCKRKRHGISELGHLNMLHGYLTIENLENVESKEEANLASIQLKEHLQELKLEWSRDWEDGGEFHGPNEVLEGLKPNTDLKMLIISSHPGNRFPSWMSNNTSLRHLEKVGIKRCQKWEALPPLCQWEFLKILEISSIDMRNIDELFRRNEGTVSFPSLKELDIRNMGQWIEWNEESLRFLPCLKKLHIENCPKLTQIPHLPQTTCHLYIREVGLKSLPNIWCGGAGAPQGKTNLPSSSLSSSLLGPVSSFSTVHIESCPDLKYLSAKLFRGCLKNVEKLRMDDCVNFEKLPNKGFTEISLKILEIVKCPKFKFHPIGQGCLPSSLMELKILGCDSMDSLGRDLFLHLTALKTLSIAGCQRLRVLELNGLTALDTLRLTACPEITSLPEEMLQPLCSLKTLLILDCRRLNCLDFGTLRSLNLMSVSKCPNLILHRRPYFSAPLKYLTVQESSLETLKLFILEASHAPLVRLIIFNCPDLTSFDSELEEALLSLVSLHELFINRCRNLLSLPSSLRTLSSLSILSIKNCDAMESLPDSGFPESLQQLWISGCPKLERYKKETGPDWNKISHISSIIIS